MGSFATVRFDWLAARAVVAARMVLCAAVVLAVGCGRSESLEELVERASHLPGVRSSGHSKLREEFRLIEENRALPEHLNCDRVPAHQNAATVLANALASAPTIEAINEQAGAYLDAVPVADETFRQAESETLGAKWFRETQQVVRASEMAKCDFGLRLERGYFNRLEFLSQVAAACRLLLVDVMAVHRENPQLALKRFGQAWQWTDWLAATHHLEARVQASLLRREALAVAEVLANRPEITVGELKQLQRPLEASLANWPSTSSTLVRERALALATYEALRLGLADLLFTSEERRQLRTDGVYDSLREASAEQIDADEAAYLAYMREVIAVADRPFYVRSKALVESDRLLRAGEHAESYPWFANRLFVLRDSLTLAQAELARDRARTEGWLYALAAATGGEAPQCDTSPLNGEKYVIEQRGGHWIVNLHDRRVVNPRVAIPAE